MAAAIDARMFHEHEQPSDEKLFNAFCPADKTGRREFAEAHKRRMKRLGFWVDNPDDLTADRSGRCSGWTSTPPASPGTG
jgi:methylenetetrahydrofolate dehydrogenase (NADP+)/methenyltetrahydrofolate cyclohydrolase/formyltetrahydrofolate synthetase